VSEIIKLPVPSSSAKSAKEHADAETERDKQLFNWADGVLKAIGKAKAIAAARSTQELKAIPLDLNSAEVVLGDSQCAPSREWQTSGAFSRSQ
jgi:hypothetical protein